MDTQHIFDICCLWSFSFIWSELTAAEAVVSVTQPTCQRLQCVRQENEFQIPNCHQHLPLWMPQIHEEHQCFLIISAIIRGNLMQASVI